MRSPKTWRVGYHPPVPRALAFPKPRRRSLAALGLVALACAHAPAPPAPAEPGPAASAPRPAEPPPAAPGPLPAAAEARSAAAAGAALAALRADADAVLRAQGETYWRLFTEGKQGDPAAAWRGRDDLLSDRSLATARAAREGAPEDRRPASYLAAWLLGERLARDAADALRDTARAREQARLTWSDHEVLLRAVPSLLAGERDRERRRALSEAAAAAASGLVQFAERGEQRIVAVARDLGYPSPLALAAELRGAPAPALAALAEDVLSRTEPTWQALLEGMARDEGLSRERGAGP